MAAWLDLIPEADGWSIVDSGRLDEIIREMSHPKTQFPSLVYFAGNGSRIKALRALFPRNNITRRGPVGLARLHLSTSTAHAENPVIFAESDLFTRSGLGDANILRYPTQKYQRFYVCSDESSSSAQLQQQIITQMILPWTHVLCLFVDSESEIRTVHRMLQAPRRKLAVGNQAIPDVMRVVIVLTENVQKECKMDDELSTLFGKDMDQSQTIILDLRNRSEFSDTVAFEPLRRLVLDHLEEVHDVDQNLQCRPFSAVHLNTLWTFNARLQERKIGLPLLDCLSIARENYPKDTSMTDGLVEFKRKMLGITGPDNDIDSFVASALLMDAYPPEMHGKTVSLPPFVCFLILIKIAFPPEMVFNTLYRKRCLASWSGADSIERCKGILTQFNQMFTQMGLQKPTAAIRKDMLTHFHTHWNGLRSTTVCFACLCRPPEHMLPCKHSICDTCAVRFGTNGSQVEYHTTLSQCPICEDPCNLTIYHLPPTKHPIIFSLDGGGVRGMMQLGLLREVERRLGGIPVAQIANLCTGTSVGMLFL